MKKLRAFSLIEVALALGIVAFALVAILGLVPVALKASKDASDDTRTSLIAQDIYNRIRSEVCTRDSSVPSAPLELSWNPALPDISYSLIANSSATPAATAYYDESGLFVNQKVSGNSTRNQYRCEILIAPLLSYPPNLQPVGVIPKVDYPYLVVCVNLGWPVEAIANGNVIPKSNSAMASYTFYLRRP